MDNFELEREIKDIIGLSNMFEMIRVAKEFEPTYKQSNFYKQTKMPLKEVIKDAKVFYTLSLNNLFDRIQYLINELDLSHLEELAAKLGETFGKENQEVMSMLNTLNDLKELAKKN